MAADYPGAVKNFLTLEDGVDTVLAQHMNERGNEITAIETELGADVAGSAADLVTRLAVRMNDNGTLKTVPESEGGTGVTSLNGLIEVGSYTGNATGIRDIAVGFTPTWVTIVGQTANPYTYYITPNMSKWQFASNQGSFTTGGTLGANKFVVGNSEQSANKNAETYDWIAFK